VTRRPVPLLAAGAAIAAIALAGCGSSNDASGSTGSAASSGGGLYGGSDTGASATTAAAKGAATISTRKTDLGTILVDSKGRTIYLWVADKGTKSTCNGGCAVAWPPVLTTGKPKAGKGVKAALLGTTKRQDGKTEVTYKGHPLYTFFEDKAPGDTTGQGSNGFGALWWVVSPSGQAITSSGS
jgi:predicted lipoprotein with Yx(FWY)xxD motif